MMTDPVSDMLTRIRNAIIAKHDRTQMPASKLKLSIAKILKQEGYIDEYSIEGDERPSLTIHLKYSSDRSSAIVGLKRTSRPGRRVYVGHAHLPRVLNGMGVSIISTSRGLLTDKDARTQHLGGEVLCEVW